MSKRYYDSIEDFPLFNWRKCQEHQDYRYCRISDEGTKKEDAKAWETIYDSYLKEFGLGKEYERVLELKSRIAELQCDFVIEDNRFLLNKIKTLQDELDEILNRPVENDTDSVIIYLERWRGFQIDERTLTVRKFYKLLREYQKEASRSKKVK